MDIDSLGEKTIEQPHTLQLVNSPAGLYSLTAEDLSRLDGFKAKSIDNLLKGIALSKNTPFESVLFAIGIRYVGKTVAEKVARHFKTIERIAEATIDDLLAAPEVGEKIARSIYEFFRVPANQREIERLKNAGLHMESTASAVETESQVLADKSFVISGVFQHYEREELQDVIIRNGGRVLSAVSGKLDFLLAGENMGPAKREKAEKLKVRIISEQDFEKLMKGEAL
jgi:DNA ligase (NAD+)